MSSWVFLGVSSLHVKPPHHSQLCKLLEAFRIYTDTLFFAAGAPLGNARLYVPSNGPNPPTYYSSPPQSESNGFDVPRGVPQAQDRSTSRGRIPELFNMNTSTFQTPQAVQTHSPRSQSSAASARSPASLNNGGIERRTSVAHGHYRQGSKLQGPYQHSRNASFVNSPATSPLSPQVTGAAPVNPSLTPESSGLTMAYHGAPELRSIDSPSSTVNGSMHASSTSALVGDREVGDMTNVMLTQKRVDRTHSSRTRRDHSHQRSQSRQQEQKTVGEYALHHLFNSVSGYDRFRDTNLCDW